MGKKRKIGKVHLERVIGRESFRVAESKRGDAREDNGFTFFLTGNKDQQRTSSGEQDEKRRKRLKKGGLTILSEEE